MRRRSGEETLDSSRGQAELYSSLRAGRESMMSGKAWQGWREGITDKANEGRRRGRVM